MPGFDGGSWQGTRVPAGTPREVVSKASLDLVKLLQAADMREKILASPDQRATRRFGRPSHQVQHA